MSLSRDRFHKRLLSKKSCCVIGSILKDAIIKGFMSSRIFNLFEGSSCSIFHPLLNQQWFKVIARYVLNLFHCKYFLSVVAFEKDLGHAAHIDSTSACTCGNVHAVPTLFTYSFFDWLRVFFAILDSKLMFCPS